MATQTHQTNIVLFSETEATPILSWQSNDACTARFILDGILSDVWYSFVILNRHPEVTAHCVALYLLLPLNILLSQFEKPHAHFLKCRYGRWRRENRKIRCSKLLSQKWCLQDSHVHEDKKKRRNRRQTLEQRRIHWDWSISILKCTSVLQCLKFIWVIRMRFVPARRSPQSSSSVEAMNFHIGKALGRRTTRDWRWNLTRLLSTTNQTHYALGAKLAMTIPSHSSWRSLHVRLSRDQEASLIRVCLGGSTSLTFRDFTILCVL